VNNVVVEGCCPEAITVEIRRVEAAEIDEMGSFVGSKAHQRWLWHAIDHLTGVVLAYVLGSRADEVVVELQKLLKPFGLVHFYTVQNQSGGSVIRHLLTSTDSRKLASAQHALDTSLFMQAFVEQNGEKPVNGGLRRFAIFGHIPSP
jgi:hypothetical protein